MIGRPAQEIRRHKSKAVLEAASAYSSSCFCFIIISYCCSLLLSHFSVFFIGVELVLLVARKKGRGGKHDGSGPAPSLSLVASAAAPTTTTGNKTPITNVSRK